MSEKQIIKTWLKDHDISLPEERIDILITMLKSEPKEDYKKAFDDMMGNPMEELEDILQQERERILSLPKYDLSKRWIDGEFYIKVEDIKTLKR